LTKTAVFLLELRHRIFRNFVITNNTTCLQPAESLRGTVLICNNDEKRRTMETKTILAKYPEHDPSVLIALLQDIQETYGYLPESELHAVAQYTDMPVSRVYGVATFYNQFRLKPLGKTVIRVCRGTACHVKGSLDILRIVESELGISAGDTTKDMKYTIETVACIGACSIAPVITISGEFHGGLTVKSVQKLLASYQKKAEEE